MRMESLDVIVGKWGGTSVSSDEDIERIGKILDMDDRRRVVVVSAPSGVTELLTNIVNARIKGEKVDDLIGEVLAKYSVFKAADMSSIENEIRETAYRDYQDMGTAAFKDSVVGLGELLHYKIVAKTLDKPAIDPGILFVMSEDYGEGTFMDESRQMIRDELEEKIRDGPVVIPGFAGYNADGDQIVTLGRGGSDQTASYIAAALQEGNHNVVEYENWTDRKGILTADPGKVLGAKKIEFITYQEIRDLALKGWKIFHSEAMIPAARARIPIHVRSSKDPDEQGTYILNTRKADPEKPIIGVTFEGGYGKIELETLGLNRIKGLYRKVGQIFEEEGISIETAPGAHDSMHVIFPAVQITDNLLKNRIERNLGEVIGDPNGVRYENGFGYLVAAGIGMKTNEHIRILNVLNRSGVEVVDSRMTAEKLGTYLIPESRGRDALQLVHDSYFGE